MMGKRKEATTTTTRSRKKETKLGKTRAGKTSFDLMKENIEALNTLVQAQSEGKCSFDDEIKTRERKATEAMAVWLDKVQAFEHTQASASDKMEHHQHATLIRLVGAIDLAAQRPDDDGQDTATLEVLGSSLAAMTEIFAVGHKGADQFQWKPDGYTVIDPKDPGKCHMNFRVNTQMV